MKVLKFFRTFFLVIALGLLVVVGIESGEYNQEKLFAQSERQTTGHAVDDPEDPWPVQEFFLLWAFRFGSGWATFQSIIMVLKLHQEKRAKKTIAISPHHWWEKGVH